MATTRKSNVVRMTADADTIEMGKGGFRIAGARLVGGVDASTAQIKITDTSGDIIISLKAAADGVDEINIPFRCDANILYLALTGTSPEVYLYLE